MNRPRGTAARALGMGAALAVLLALWGLGAALVHRPLLPGPLETLGRLGALASQGTLTPHLAASLGRIFGALALALGPAAALGLAAGLSSRTDRIVGPLLYLVHPIPKVVFLPLFFLLLGLGDAPKVALVAFIVFSQVAVAARDGARRLPPGLLDQMRVLGARRRDLWAAVVVPGVLPELFSALRIALGTSVAVLFFAESFASESGLGWFITDAWARVDYLDLYAGVTALALVGLGLLALADLGERLFCPWRV